MGFRYIPFSSLFHNLGYVEIQNWNNVYKRTDKHIMQYLFIAPVHSILTFEFTSELRERLSINVQGGVWGIVLISTNEL